MFDLFFCPERWKPDEISSNIASQVTVSDFRGKPVEAWQIGDWSQNWSAIQSTINIEPGWLESDGDYRFCFWLNGGENVAQDETCMLEIFGDDWENRPTFRLNREHTKPLIEKNGWLLFAIPFKAPQAEKMLHFRFVAAGAVCTIAGIPDMDMAACEAIPSDVRSFDHPQRHNLVFPNGYPDAPREKVVIQSAGHEIALSKRILRNAAVVAGVMVGAVLLYHGAKKKHK